MTLSSKGFKLDITKGKDVFESTHSAVIYKGKLFYACSFAPSRFTAIRWAIMQMQNECPYLFK